MFLDDGRVEVPQSTEILSLPYALHQHLEVALNRVGTYDLSLIILLNLLQLIFFCQNFHIWIHTCSMYLCSTHVAVSYIVLC